MAGVAGARIGLAAGSQSNIAPTQTLLDGMGKGSASGTMISKGCTTNFIGFGLGLSNQEPKPNDLSATEDRVIRAATGGTLQTPAYAAIAGNTSDETLSWTVGAAGTAPVNTVAPAITGTAQVGQTLTCSTGTWTGAPAPTQTYEWLIGGVNTGYTGSTFVCKAADVGKTAVARVTGTNPVASVSVNTAATAAIIA